MGTNAAPDFDFLADRLLHGFRLYSTQGYRFDCSAVVAVPKTFPRPFRSTSLRGKTLVSELLMLAQVAQGKKVRCGAACRPGLKSAEGASSSVARDPLPWRSRGLTPPLGSAPLLVEAHKYTI